MRQAFSALLAALMAIVACGDVPTSNPISVRHFVTEMSVVGPELHVLLKNKSNEHVRFKINALDLTCQQQPNGTDRTQVHTPAQRERPWDLRREMYISTAGIIPAHGFSHRIYAFGHLDFRQFPCIARLEVDSGSNSQTIAAKIDRVVSAAPLGSRVIPNVDAYVWVDEDFVDNTMLMHVVVETRDERAFNVGVLDRAIICPDGGFASWDLIQDVPQGLSAGPARLDPGSGVAFMGVISATDEQFLESCTIEVKLGVEVTPTGFAPLKVVRVPVVVHPGMHFVGGKSGLTRD